MTPDQQLQAWRFGIPVHNPTRDECCPDFSCCTGKLADRSLREKFVEAYEAEDMPGQWAILGMFLSGTLADADLDAHVAGVGWPEQ